MADAKRSFPQQPDSPISIGKSVVERALKRLTAISIFGAWLTGMIGLCSLAGAVSAYADAINLIAPLWQAAGLVLIATAALLASGRKRKALAIPAISLFISFAVTVLPDWAAQSSRPADSDCHALRIVILNAWKENATPERAARWIALQSPDIVLLEEIDWGSTGIPARLKRLYPYRQDCSGLRYCSTAILSRLKPVASGGLAQGDSENRGALSAAWMRFADACGPYDVVGVHLNHPWPMSGRVGERRELAKFLRGRGHRAILAGDLNLPSWTFELGRLEHDTGLSQRTLSLATWPSPSARGWLKTPVFPLDHLLAGEAWTTDSVKRGPDIGSDHYPVAIRLSASANCASPAS